MSKNFEALKRITEEEGLAQVLRWLGGEVVDGQSNDKVISQDIDYEGIMLHSLLIGSDNKEYRSAVRCLQDARLSTVHDLMHLDMRYDAGFCVKNDYGGRKRIVGYGKVKHYAVLHMLRVRFGEEALLKDFVHLPMVNRYLSENPENLPI